MKKENKPIKINKDIWFYRNKSSLDFVVWTPFGAVQFRVKLTDIFPKLKALKR